MPNHVDLAGDDVIGAGRQIGNGDIGFESVRIPVQLTLIEAGQVKHGLRSVFDGMVPVLMQTPPIMCLRSTIAALLPSLAAAIAAFCPAGPDPITTTSKWSTVVSPPHRWDFCPDDLGSGRMRPHVERLISLDIR